MPEKNNQDNTVRDLLAYLDYASGRRTDEDTLFAVARYLTKQFFSKQDL
jgi:hypothetical protein